MGLIFAGKTSFSKVKKSIYARFFLHYNLVNFQDQNMLFLAQKEKNFCLRLLYQGSHVKIKEKYFFKNQLLKLNVSRSPRELTAIS